MTAPASPLASPLPSVRVAIKSGVLAAGVSALLASAGFTLLEQADVLVVDDGWLSDPETLADFSGVVALGSLSWVNILPDVVSGGWAALSADASVGELLAGVLGAAAGLAVLPPEQVHFQTDADSDPQEDDLNLPESDVTLTPRERDVLSLLTEGLSNKRVARELGVTESTVKFHVQAVYSKLGVQSRAAAVTRGIQLGLVSV